MGSNKASLGYLCEGGFAGFDKSRKVSVWSFSDRDPHVNLQSVDEHLIDPVSTPKALVSAEL